MTTGFRFPTDSEHLEQILKELRELRSALQDISRRTAQIELRVRRAFGVPRVASSGRQKDRAQEVTLTKESALQLFDRASELAKSNLRGAEELITSLGAADLKFLAHELGVSSTDKPSGSKLRQRILGKVNERLMLSRNITVAERTAQTGQKDG